jgi:hypothetical protein
VISGNGHRRLGWEIGQKRRIIMGTCYDTSIAENACKDVASDIQGFLDGEWDGNREGWEALAQRLNDAYLSSEDRPKQPQNDLASTNLLLGNIVGELRGLRHHSGQSYDAARRRHNEWQDMLTHAVEVQVKTQKVGAITVVCGICFMSTLISVVVSLLL